MDKSRREILKKIAEITQFLESGMCPPKDREHFEQRLKSLEQLYEKPE
jgi:hypothetical protein